ncbi:MAG: YifB family Mg chelatase-like AAA ATPase [Dermatophilaceae bacterium]
MILGATTAVALEGLEGRAVRVEAQLSNSLPGLIVSGLPDAACRQAPERVRAACNSAGAPLPVKKIVVNLSPASVPKAGTGFDLGIALAILAAGGAVPQDRCGGVVHLGELGLDGSVRGVSGILPAIRFAAHSGFRDAVVPLDNGAEAGIIEGIRIHPVGSLAEVIRAYAVLGAPEKWPACAMVAPAPVAARKVADLTDIVGQSEARLALELAAAGGHHLLFTGPPGSGKTMLAERMVGVLPPLGFDAAVEVLSIRSLRGDTRTGGGLDLRPPFVAPHHGSSLAAMVGGGSGTIRPGAVSAAHRGLLFLDEAPEFRTDVLQSLRQPLESGRVVIARARETVTYPARFQLVLAANPCPCGQGSGKALHCSCTPQRRRAYAARLRGPLLDRVDLQVHVPAVTRSRSVGTLGEASDVVAQRVANARAAAVERWRGGGWERNADVPGPALRTGRFALPRDVTRELDFALESGRLTLRGYDRTLRLAWTQADVRGRSVPAADDVGMALLLRINDQGTAA